MRGLEFRPTYSWLPLTNLYDFLNPPFPTTNTVLNSCDLYFYVTQTAEHHGNEEFFVRPYNVENKQGLT